MKDVTVVIPSYNRSHVLEKTIPTYIQECVEEIIIVNDCSTDNTLNTLNKLKQEYKIIKIINNKENKKQAASKNIALQYVKTKYVYFGDDDSYLDENCIITLLNELKDNPNVGLVAANAIYLNEEYKPILRVSDSSVDFPSMSVNYTRILDNPIDSVFCPACFVIETELAKRIQFNEKKYLGNGYREETDFVLNVRKKGLKTLLQGRVSQINLPRSVSHGGSHAKTGLIYEYYCIKNTYLFLKEHYDYLSKIQPYSFFYLLLFSSILRLRGYLANNKVLYNIYKFIKG